MSAEKRRLLEKYDMGDVLGKGGFGEVRLGTRKSDGKKVAIKVISKLKFATDEDHIHMQTEVELMMRARGHKNVVEIYEYFEDRTAFWIVMELCTGGELMERIVKSSSFSERDASIYFRQMLLGVQHCHQNLVVHRDLKPENFLLESKEVDAELKLTDFGLSIGIKHPDEVLSEGLGSAYYIAPEVFRRRYTRSVDVWALGVILYLLLCGEVPFGHHAETEMEVYRAIQEDALAFGPYWSTLSSASREIVAGLLEKDPTKRYTIEQALEHPWVTGAAAVHTPLERSVLTSLITFNNRNKFKKIALKTVANKLSANDVRQLRDAFNKIDTDNTGFITFNELREALVEVGMSDQEKNIEAMLKSVDDDGDSRISWEEFLEATMERQIIKYQASLWEVFCEYDTDGSGAISADEMRAFLKDEPLELIEQYIAEFDRDGNGQIDYEEFLTMFLPKNARFKVAKA